jgi:DNA-binding winged helix-turn-helix (wHTH) protein
VNGSPRLRRSEFELDGEEFRVLADGNVVELTRIEFRLLREFVERRGSVQSRRQLLLSVWDTSARIETRTVDMHVARLRSKLGDLGDLIETVRGVGYRMRTLSILIGALVLTMPATSAAQVEIKAGSAEVEFSGRIQYQVETTTCTEAIPDAASACSSEQPGLDMFLRRARFSIEAKIDERFTMKIEPDFADVNEVSLKDAWGRYTFSSVVSFKAGHFKRPFDGFFLISSSWLPFERAVSIPGVSSSMLPSYSGFTKSFGLADRDIGFMFEGRTQNKAFRYWVGAFTGASEFMASDSNTEKQFVGRAQITLDAGGAPLDLAGAIAVTDAPFTATGGETEAEYFTNLELWAELGGYGEDGLLIQAGFIVGDNPQINELGGDINLAAGEQFASLLSWQGVAGYRIPVDGAEWLEAVSPILRVSYGDPNTNVDDDEAWGFTPGFTLYFHKRNRLALTWDVASFGADGIDSENAFRTQMQFQF